MSFTGVPVAGDYRLVSGGGACSGTVTFTLSAQLSDGQGDTVPTTPITATLDASGNISLNLTATDDPTTTPQGAYYQVEEQIAGNPARYYTLQVSRAQAAGGIDLSVVAPVPTSGGFNYDLVPAIAGIHTDQTDNPQPLGTAAPGNTGRFSDAGHVHPGVVASYKAVGLTAAVTNAVNYTPPAVQGLYRITIMYRPQITGASTSVGVTMTGAEVAGPFTFTSMPFIHQQSTIVMPPFGNTGGDIITCQYVLLTDTSATPITVSTTGTFTGTTYALGVAIERLF